MNRLWAPGDAPPTTVCDPAAPILRNLIDEATGVFFEDSRWPHMLEKLEPRLEATQCQTYLDYYYLLRYDTRAEQEWRRVMDAFSVQETYFWREMDQIRLIVDKIVPEWFLKQSGPLKIWSAACASGEEPYSVAIALEEAGWGSHPIQILASDGSERALERARAASYRERSFRNLPEVLREKYFRRDGSEYVLNADIRARVDFRWANLVGLEDSEDFRNIPVILCRNVFIYFSQPNVRRTVLDFARRMKPGSHLFVGASESLLKLTEDFELQEIRRSFAYVRKPANAACPLRSP